MIDIKSFIKSNYREESYALIFNNGYEIETISVERYLYEVVENMTGEYTLSEILQKLNINRVDVEEFIDFLLEMELIVPEKSGT